MILNFKLNDHSNLGSSFCCEEYITILIYHHYIFYYLYYYYGRFSINSSEIFVSHPNLQLFEKYTLWTNFAVFPLGEKTYATLCPCVCLCMYMHVLYLKRILGPTNERKIQYLSFCIWIILHTMISSEIHFPENNALSFIFSVSHTHTMHIAYIIYNDIVYMYTHYFLFHLSVHQYLRLNPCHGYHK